MSTANGHSPARSLPPVDWAGPHDDAVVQLERQLVRGSHFAQAALDKLQARLARTEASLGALHELLMAAGLIVEAEAEPSEAESPEAEPSEAEPSEAQPPQAEPSEAEPSATQPSEAELSEPVAEDDSPAAQVETSAAPEEDDGRSPMPVNWPAIAFRTEPVEPEEPAPVDCGARMHICHAVCCKLSFALTPPEVESGTTKWDLGFPYMIRQESNGYCTHNDTATGRCGIYANRPGVCRRYSCANDTRIWKDFDNMELNEDWIRENLQNRSRILVRPSLPVMEINGVPTTS